MYDGSAISNILSDEAGLGDQEIGFLYIKDGNIFVAYDDESSDGFNIGFLQGRVLKNLRSFKGSLPNHRQKALYKDTIIFISSGDIWSIGASAASLPIQISKLADAGHATVGALATPFGTPMVASTDGGSNHRLAKFSGFSLDSNWKSLFLDITNDRKIGSIDTIIVYTKALGANASCTIILEGNQGEVDDSTAITISGENKTRHLETSIDLQDGIEDVRVLIDYAAGNTAQTVPIRKISLLGTFAED